MTSSKSTILLEHHLKQLKLPTIYREYQVGRPQFSWTVIKTG